MTNERLIMTQDILTGLRPAIVMGLLFALLLGLAYPFALLGVGQAVFPHQANGSLVVERGRVVGSELIGQAFAADRYFHGRPSAAGKGYDGLASSGSNLGPTSRALADRVKADVAALGTGAVPADLATASGSGLDPDISPAAAEWQVGRIARARGIAPAAVRRIIASETRGPVLGFIGDARVNVLALNRRLDGQRSD
ncbi:potassium-transporting ATPase, C subunit [Rhizorhabdus wittichii RW1]|uniref:Potassium-transporting ATPase KdpC subunit n=1 Tax=Rhizorhabdus wittichii (strain DSM 6014 / CCUG 31198 / JCM 15750 / NBRC 105917 / EY 4224 / RW1) TaxID=392499 RepID=A0A9J9HA44_RHIWR|nr:potassium-transporting ATPase, C subunit [Rhizorhabdus wittichii RW1]